MTRRTFTNCCSFASVNGRGGDVFQKVTSIRSTKVVESTVEWWVMFCNCNSAIETWTEPRWDFFCQCIFSCCFCSNLANLEATSCAGTTSFQHGKDGKRERHKSKWKWVHFVLRKGGQFVRIGFWRSWAMKIMRILSYLRILSLFQGRTFVGTSQPVARYRFFITGLRLPLLFQAYFCNISLYTSQSKIKEK